jgi:alginate O-acetyltransferase complex protein AlgI
MAFNSVPYLALLAIAVAAFWLLPASFRRPFVFLASVTFYASWGLQFVWFPLLVASTVYFAGRRITNEQTPAKHWVKAGVLFLLAPLIFFKYRGFLLANLQEIGIGRGASLPPWLTTLLFPVGISFLTFEAIGYLVDLRQGRVKMPGFFDLCLFFFFWPNILSGPIVRARELMPQLKFQKPFEPRFIFEGMDRLIWGLVQKNVIANLLGVWVDRGFAQSQKAPYSTVDAWCLAIGFALQIYFDFSAYTNMAIGAAKFLGVSLPENFRQPYHAATPPEFWARWHMTLSRWVRDYLFFPINAKYAGAPLPLHLSLVGVMALVGLWHGAGWGFLVWGSLHGVYLVLYRLYESWRNGKPGSANSPAAGVLWRIFTLMAVTAAWVPFRAATLRSAGQLLASMFFRMRPAATFGTGFYLFLAVVAALCAAEPWLMQKLNVFEEQAGADGLSVFHVLVRPIAYSFGLLLFLLFDENNTQFIYSQF